jgi:hypothetical protein
MSKTVVTTTINRTYLKNKTKDEIIDLLLYILDTRCEADAKIETHVAEIARLDKALSEIEAFPDGYWSGEANLDYELSKRIGIARAAREREVEG